MSSEPSISIPADSLPTEATRRASPEPAGLEILWSAGQRVFYPSKLLRSKCPCASCAENRGESNHSKPLTGAAKLRVLSATVEEELNLEKIWPVGNYALGMRWGDGHDSGIYTYTFLRELAAEACSDG